MNLRKSKAEKYPLKSEAKPGLLGRNLQGKALVFSESPVPVLNYRPSKCCTTPPPFLAQSRLEQSHAKLTSGGGKKAEFSPSALSSTQWEPQKERGWRKCLGACAPQVLTNSPKVGWCQCFSYFTYPFWCPVLGTVVQKYILNLCLPMNHKQSIG